jgi:hypothetical protein
MTPKIGPERVHPFKSEITGVMVGTTYLVDLGILDFERIRRLVSEGGLFRTLSYEELLRGCYKRKPKGRLDGQILWMGFAIARAARFS